MERDDDGVTRRTILQGAAGVLALGTVGAPAIARSRPARERLEAALARIADPVGEGKRAYLTLYTDSARLAADAADARADAPLSPIDGAIVSIKDLFDVAGEPTRAGSLILADASPARTDAPVVARLKRAGAVIIGKTNMVEFAFSGVGVNPHYGTPGNPADRSRVPGGSTSGGGVAVADAMCDIAIGTDTGGSCRIPAALCGVVGYKPTKARVPTQGAFPLSPTLDSIGPIATSVDACFRADAILSGDAARPLDIAPLQGLRAGIPQGLPLLDLDATVAACFADALARLGKAGVALSDEIFPQFDTMQALQTPVPIASAEAYAIHRQRIASRAKDFDPIVLARMQAGRDVTPERLQQMLTERAALVRSMDGQMARLDVLVLPTTPIVAPTMAEVANPDIFIARNRLLLRNTGLGNVFDLCAISLPLPRNGGLPVGLMLMARSGQDQRLFAIAAAVEKLLSA